MMMVVNRGKEYGPGVNSQLRVVIDDLCLRATIIVLAVFFHARLGHSALHVQD